MKILQVNCVYKKGSTGKIMYDIHSELLKRDISSIVCYGRGVSTKDANVYKVCGETYSKINQFRSMLTGLMYGGLYFSTKKLLRIIMFEQPDVVHLHCINGYFVNIYKLIRFLKNKKIKTVLTLHADFMFTANCGIAVDCNRWLIGCGKCPNLKKETKSLIFDRTHTSWIKMRNAFQGFEKYITIVSVSPWLMGRAKTSPILSAMHHVCIKNGLDTSVFFYRKENSLDLGIKEKVIFHVTPLFSTEEGNFKGGHFILKLAKLLPEFKFLIAGNYSNITDLPENIILLGRISDQSLLAQYYSKADITILTSKRETFSMVTAESLCCGTPVVGFKAGGPEMIALKEYSDFVEYGDIFSLKESILKVLSLDYVKEEISKKAITIYSRENMVQQYINVYFDLLYR